MHAGDHQPFRVDAVRAFEAAARHGSLARAADEPARTEGAVSRQIGRLEAFLGVTVFERAGNRVRLAPNGMRYAVQVRPVAPWPDGKAVTQNFCLERWPRKFGQSDKWFGRGLSRR